MTAIPPAATPQEGQLSANLICMASMLVWALGFPAVDVLLLSFPPLQLTAARMLLAALALLPIWLMIEGPAAIARADWRRGLMIGAIGFGLGAYLLVFAQQLTDGVTVAVITASMPVVGIALECVLDGRKLTVRLVGGLILSLAGGFLAYAAGIGALRFGPGAWAALGSVLCFCWGSRATVADLPNLSAIARTSVTICGAAFATGVIAGAQLLTGSAVVHWAGLGATEIALLALYGFGSLALSQVLWIVGVGQLGIGIAGMHINAAPFYVMAFAYLLGGTWNTAQAFGAVVVALGVIVAQSRSRRRRAI